MSVFCAAYYAYKGYFNPIESLNYIPFGIPGALAGSLLLSKLSDRFLKKLFAAFIIWAGIRMIFK